MPGVASPGRVSPELLGLDPGVRRRVHGLRRGLIPCNGLSIIRPLGGATVSVYSIWESRFPAETAQEGISVTRAIWHDMLAFNGYLAHELIQDLDQPGHLIVVSRWASREDADAAMSYLSHPNAKRAEQLVSEPRRRTVGAPL
jgi:quinol monooxygenase YgiN